MNYKMTKRNVACLHMSRHKVRIVASVLEATWVCRRIESRCSSEPRLRCAQTEDMVSAVQGVEGKGNKSCIVQRCRQLFFRVLGMRRFDNRKYCSVFFL